MFNHFNMDYYDWCRCGYVLNRKPVNLYSDLMNDIEEIFNTENDFNRHLKFFLRSIRWKEFCTDYGSSPQMFSFFKKLAIAKKCSTDLMVNFLKTCGHDLANWVIHEGSRSALSLLLHHAKISKLNLWKKRASDGKTILRYHPVTECMYYGRWRNIDLLLSYGYNLEQRDFVHSKLVEDVFSKIGISSEGRAYLKEVKFNPYRKRGFFVCMVIRTYFYEDEYPYRGCDAALKSIWDHLPDAYLNRNEFLSILDPFPAKLNLLGGMYDRYLSTVCDGDYSLVQQPRTLTHYCRSRIRYTLSKNFLLPDGVHELPIPVRLKDYLLHK